MAKQKLKNTNKSYKGLGIIMNSNRINIFIGHFGSGKTETALNFAKEISKNSDKTTLVDLDIVNPFFRSSDADNELAKLNIKLIKPVYANSNSDVPALPAEINSVLQNRNQCVIFDVGGDDLGSRAISTYKSSIETEDYAMYFVINTKRPNTSSFELIEKMLFDVESATRLKVTHLVNNTNLLKDTKACDILKGNDIIKSVAEKHKIEFAFICATTEMANEISSKTEDNILILEQIIKLPWDKE